MATKLRAARIVTEAGADMVIANGQAPEVLYDILGASPRAPALPEKGALHDNDERTAGNRAGGPRHAGACREQKPAPGRCAAWRRA